MIFENRQLWPARGAPAYNENMRSEPQLEAEPLEEPLKLETF